MPDNCPFDISPYAKSEVTKPPQSISLNYTNQDFYSMKTRLVNFLNERFGPNGSMLPNTFNDLVESSIAIMLIENWAFLADTLSFKMDQIVNELFIDTVTEVENAFRLAKLVGFKPQPPIAARSMWIATINNTLTTDLVIPTPVSIDLTSNDAPIRIELFPANSDNEPLLDEDIVIPAGSTFNQNIIGIEGITRIDEFVGTGEPAQTYQLLNGSVIYDSVRVEVDGSLWREVEYFTDSQPRKEFRVEFDSDYNGYIMFGNNRSGMIPSSGSRIRVTYRTGGGTIGNIVTGVVETQKQATVPGLAFSVPISFRNYTKGQYGYDGDTIEDIRRKLPRWSRIQDRIVTGEDYKNFADQFTTPYHGQVGKSIAALRNHGCSGNIIDLYILAKSDTDGLEEAGNELKVSLSEEINEKKMLTDFVCIRDGVVVNVDVEVDVTLDKFYRKFELEYRENIQRRITNFFSLHNWEYGKTLRDADLIKELSDIKEIETYDINFVTSDSDNSGSIVTTRFMEIIRPDQITITFLYK